MSDAVRSDPLRVATPFTLVPGRGAASGRRDYSELGGSIAAQKPHFLSRGLDLSGFYNGTLNCDISPKRFSILAPRLTLEAIKWHPSLPAETFSFCAAAVELGAAIFPALVYYPHPETKGPYADMPPDTMIEILAPRIDAAAYGAKGVLWTDPEEVWVGEG